MKKKIIIIFLILAVIIFGFYILGGKRFQKTNIFQNDSKTTEKNSSSDSNTSEDNAANNDFSAAPNINVKPSDCDNECIRFEKNDAELDYCEQVCGISDLYEQDYENAEGEVDEATCQKQVGIKKDYCLKDLAISEDDSEICAQIQDANIKKTCTNRFIEDMLEEQNSPPSEDY